MSRRSLLLAVPVLALTLALGVLIGAILQPVGGSSARAGSAAPASGSSGAAAQVATPAAGGASAPRTVSVGGEGRVAVRPDLAYAVFGVDTTNASLAQAQAENNQRMTAVLDKLKARGLQDRDLQTVGFSVSPQYDREGRPNGYRVSNGVRATVRDLTALGPIIEETVAAGATTVRGISFDIANKEDAVRQAREAAVKNARDKADQYARFAGVQLGGPVKIDEQTAPSQPAVPQPAAAPAAGRAADAPPIEAGEGYVVVTVEVTYEIR